MRRLCVIAALIFTAVLSASAQAPTRSSAEIERRIDSIVIQMTLAEKLAMLGGVDGFFTRDVPRLNLPRLKMADGPLGVRNLSAVSSSPPATTRRPTTV